MKALVLAFQFLTVVPLPSVKPEDRAFGQAMMLFPAVGLALGAFLYLCNSMLNYVNPELPPQLSAFTLLLILAIATRALHLEALSDFLDGFLGGCDRDAILRIMKDSRAGAFGVIGLVLLLLGKFLFLTQIVAANKTIWLLVVTALSRWSMVILCAGMRDPRKNGGLATAFLQSLNARHIIAATLLAILPLAFFPILHSIFVFGTCLIIVGTVRRVAKTKIGGLTGDVIGAVCEMTELAALFTVCIVNPSNIPG